MTTLVYNKFTRIQIEFKKILKPLHTRFLISHSTGVTTHTYLTDALTTPSFYSPFYHTHPLSFYFIK